MRGITFGGRGSGTDSHLRKRKNEVGFVLNYVALPGEKRENGKKPGKTRVFAGVKNLKN